MPGQVAKNPPSGPSPRPRPPRVSTREDRPAPPSGDELSLTSIRVQVLDLQSRIAQLKLAEERKLGAILNDQLTYLEDKARVQKATLEFALSKIAAQRGALPLVIEYQSVDYSFLKQIEGQELRVAGQIYRLEAYVQDLRERSNDVLAQVNGGTIAGTADMDRRIAMMRATIAEVSGSPLTKDLLAERLR